MAGETGTTIIVAQAEDQVTGEEHVVVEGADEHAVDETHASTEAHGGEEHSEVFPPFDTSTFGPQLFWLALTFGVLYLLMSRIALPRIGEILEVRRDRIEGDLAEAERLRHQTDEAIEAYESELAAARQKAHGLAEETREQIKADLAARRAEVEGELGEKVAAAESRIQQTKDAALSSVDDIAAETAVALVGQISGTVTDKAARDAVAKVVKG